MRTAKATTSAPLSHSTFCLRRGALTFPKPCAVEPRSTPAPLATGGAVMSPACCLSFGTPLCLHGDDWTVHMGAYKAPTAPHPKSLAAALALLLRAFAAVTLSHSNEYGVAHTNSAASVTRGWVRAQPAWCSGPRSPCHGPHSASRLTFSLQ